MSRLYTSVFSFEGEGFSRLMFDEKALVEYLGTLDNDEDQITSGPLGRFYYNSARSRFFVMPDEVGVSSTDPEIFPEKLTGAATFIASEIGSRKVEGINIDCETAFGPEELGQSASDFCISLLNRARAENLIGIQMEFVIPNIRFQFGVKKEMFVDVRMEPHLESESDGEEKLLVVANSFQHMEHGEKLAEKISAVEHISAYLKSLYGKIPEHGGEGD